MKVIFRFISRLDTNEERICELEDVSVDTSKTKRQRKKAWKKQPEENTQELWDNYKKYNMYIMGIPEGEEKEKGRQYLKQ